MGAQGFGSIGSTDRRRLALEKLTTGAGRQRILNEFESRHRERGRRVSSVVFLYDEISRTHDHKAIQPRADNEMEFEWRTLFAGGGHVKDALITRVDRKCMLAWELPVR